MQHELTWRKLLSPERAPSNRPKRSEGGSNAPAGGTPEDRTPFEQDHDRIVFSAPFRRLARKTQVHPMAVNDHIHNRLTHSIEVASVGRSFARRLGRIATERSDLRASDLPDLAWVLQSACLIHDLGNPPFGHAGEAVVREWAKGHEDLLFPDRHLQADPSLEDRKADWFLFEGNAQGFRLSSRPDNPLAGYLRITYATLGAAIKYPWSSADPRARAKGKHNIYSTEVGLFEEMADTLGLIAGDGRCRRHPLSFLTEAADDICYRVIDLEDAVEMGVCEHDEIHSLLAEISQKSRDEKMPLGQLRGLAIKSLMGQCWSVFEDDFDAIMHGERADDLKSSLDSECKDQLKKVNELYRKIFGHRKKIATELGAYQVLGRILKALARTIHSIVDSATYDDVHFLSKRTIELTWGEEHVRENLGNGNGYDWWLSQVMDFVSGMTDDYATRLSQEISGQTPAG